MAKRTWINKGTVAVVTGGETFIPGEWLTLDETWGTPCHPDIVEADVYLLKQVAAAISDLIGLIEADGLSTGVRADMMKVAVQGFTEGLMMAGTEMATGK